MSLSRSSIFDVSSAFEPSYSTIFTRGRSSRLNVMCLPITPFSYGSSVTSIQRLSRKLVAQSRWKSASADVLS